MIKAETVVGKIVGGQDTIVARATPPGRSAIAVLRISGLQAFDLSALILKPWPLDSRQVTLCRISDELGEIVDHGLVAAFPSPDSFTGEDVVEISTHGGSYVIRRVTSALISLGAREAAPGEFTRRAVLNGKLDITQAEAIGEIIDARSRSMHRIALNQLDGGLRRRIEALRADLISVAALIAYDIDFPEEDDGPISRDRIREESQRVIDLLDGLLATIPMGELIREGAIVVIAGEPNVGKSSLFNALLGQSRAIVTEIPGTTRDAIEGFIETKQWPLRLVDTAGIRETSDKIEQMGIEVSEKYLDQAHVILACGDSKESLNRTLSALAGKTAAQMVLVRTKADLAETSKPLTSAISGDVEVKEDVQVSAETGAGLEPLLELIDKILSNAVGSNVSDLPVLTRARHISAIQRARDELVMFCEAWQVGNLPAPVAAVHLQAGVSALETLVGAVSTDDVLDRVFSSFCVGK